MDGRVEPHLPPPPQASAPVCTSTAERPTEHLFASVPVVWRLKPKEPLVYKRLRLRQASDVYVHGLLPGLCRARPPKESALSLGHSLCLHPGKVEEGVGGRGGELSASGAPAIAAMILTGLLSPISNSLLRGFTPPHHHHHHQHQQQPLPQHKGLSVGPGRHPRSQLGQVAIPTGSINCNAVLLDPKLPSLDLNESPGNNKALVHRGTSRSTMFANQHAVPCSAPLMDGVSRPMRPAVLSQPAQRPRPAEVQSGKGAERRGVITRLDSLCPLPALLRGDNLFSTDGETHWSPGNPVSCILNWSPSDSFPDTRRYRFPFISWRRPNSSAQSANGSLLEAAVRAACKRNCAPMM
ncbi:unnamed protein product [Pleuronectes platessa]|uniref:Uncharacterized protein n=1 Tax=Pleuronectes platessa TaxID=8262 RepID=A0A9N7UEC0_PLEPL|nr:unnamed protein product [Pleuronectes platessa]